MASPTRARTLSEALRARTVDQLADLLRLRPDLVTPPPADVADLAARSTRTTSVARALDQLDLWRRTVAEGLAALPDPATLTEVADLLAAPVAAVRDAVGALDRRALVWGDERALHLVRPLREVFEPYPGGLAPPSPRPLADGDIVHELAGCDERARAVLDRLLWSPAGALPRPDRPARRDGGSPSPLEDLLARRLLRPLTADTVLLPREVALVLRAGRFSPEPVPVDPPAAVPPTAPARRPDLVDRAAAGAAFALLHDVERVVASLEAGAPRLLRDGGLPARDLTALQRALGSTAEHAAFVVECAAAAGLIAASTTSALTPTSGFDRWLDRDAATRWREVVDGWLDAERFFGASTGSGHPLGPEAHSSAAPDLRRTVLELLATAGRGVVLDAGTLETAASWQRPRLRRPPLDAATVVGWTLREAGWLGLTALGAGSAYAAAALQDAALPADLAAHFPEPVDQIVVQSDLTAIAAGPLVARVAVELRLLADQESRGGGEVYRFGAASLRRAFDAGWSADQVHRWLAAHSRTALPQALTYLVDDVARRHGTVRVGAVTSFITTADDAQAAALVRRPEAAALGLRLIAPGVLVAQVEADELVLALRGWGVSALAEDQSGQVVSTPAPARAPAPARPGRNRDSAEDVAARLLAGERAQLARDRIGPDSLDRRLLEQAAATRAPVSVAYVSADGRPHRRELAPTELSGGVVRARDRGTDQMVSIPLGRISEVRPSRW